MIRCQGTLPPTFGTRNGWPAETRVRCHRRIGVANGYCPAHRNQRIDPSLEAVWEAMTPDERRVATARALNWQVPRPDPELRERVEHETEHDRTETTEHYRDAMMDSGRGGLLR